MGSGKEDCEDSDRLREGGGWLSEEVAPEGAAKTRVGSGGE